MARSSNGLGKLIFNQKIGVQFSYGLPNIWLAFKRKDEDMSCEMENEFVEFLSRYDIAYTRPDREGGRLDFYLPAYRLYVELKTYECERLADQLSSVTRDGGSVMVLVGPDSVSRFRELLLSFVLVAQMHSASVS